MKARIRDFNLQELNELRLLINSAYKELSDRGWNYTATYQDEATTLERINQGKAFVVELNSELAGTILFTHKNYFSGRNTAYLGQFAVRPDLKRNGIGTMLMNYCESYAQEQGYEGVQLDTAQPAEHLVNWYLKRGYKIIGETQWEGKTYKSFIFEKLFKSLD